MQTASATARTMTIDGQPTASDATFGVINPATGEVFDQAPECSRSDLDGAMEAATRAFASSWRDDEAHRREVLLSCARRARRRSGRAGRDPHT